jgi:hypothetical protein
MLVSTLVDSWDRTVIPGRTSATGSAKILYDPNDDAAETFFNSILLDTKGEVAISLILDSATGESYPRAVHVTSASHAVVKGGAQMRDISFKVSDVGINLEIVGSAQAAEGATQLYTGAVYGLSGAWTFLWTSSGPTIADPTSQSTNITFPDLGSFTLTLTATLGTTVLTDTLTIEVVAVPLMWISRPNYLMASVGHPLNGLAHMDNDAQEVYWVRPTWPDISVEPESTSLTKYNYQGIPLVRKKITGLEMNPAISQYETPSVIQVLADGGLLLAFNRFSGSHFMKITADLSTISWSNKYTGFWQIGGGLYDEATDRFFFFSTGGASIGYVDMATGALTRVSTTPSPAFTFSDCKPIKQSNGRILFVFNSNDNVVFLECNTDLRVGGVFQPVRVVQHSITGLSGSGIAVMETDNYIATAHQGANAISLFNKSDFTHVKTRVFGSGGVFNAYYSGGEFVINVANGTNGWYVDKLNEALTSHTSRTHIYTSDSLGPTYPPSGTGTVVPTRNSAQPADIGGNYDPAVGMLAVHVNNRNAALTTAEILVVNRSNYAASNVLNYGTFRMVINPTTPTGLANTLLTPTSTLSRSYTFSEMANTTTSATVTIANDTKSYLEYVLAS